MHLPVYFNKNIFKFNELIFIYFCSQYRFPLISCVYAEIYYSAQAVITFL